MSGDVLAVFLAVVTARFLGSGALDRVAKVRHIGCAHHPDGSQRPPSGRVVEEPQPAPEHDGNDVQLHLVDESGRQTLAS